MIELVACWKCGSGRATTEAWCPTCRAPAVGPAATATVSAARFTPAVFVAFCAAAALIAGSFLPWVKLTAPLVGTVTKSGMEGGDGVFTLIGGVVVAGLAFATFAAGARAYVRVALIVVGLGAGLLVGYEVGDISRRFAEVHNGEMGNMFVTTYGAGIWLLGLGAVAAVVAGAIARKR